MAASWLAQPERSTPRTLALISWIARRMGRRVARWLLYPISAYFVLFSPAARHASIGYLRRILGGPVGWAEVFRHYHCFASTILDRVYLLSGREDLLDITVHGEEPHRFRNAEGRGCLLVGSHLGSFEVLRAMGARRCPRTIRVLMYEENARMMEGVLRAISPEIAVNVIPLGRPDTLLHVKEALDRGELVGLLGDRALSDDKSVSCTFLGERALFPLGPMRLASLLKVPVVLFFGLYRSANRYEIYFETLSDDMSSARNNAEHIRYWTQRYAERLEHYCRIAPYNWFNFYDFWETRQQDAVPVTA